MKKVFYLKTCDTSRRIISKFKNCLDGFEYREIKDTPITVEELEYIKKLSGSYEAVFSRRAKKYKEMGLKDFSLTEEDCKYYLLSDYTFLKRPVFVFNDKIFAGSSKKILMELSKMICDEE